MPVLDLRDLLTSHKVALVLEVSDRYVLDLVHDGEFPNHVVTPLGKLFTKEDVEACWERRVAAAMEASRVAAERAATAEPVR